MEQIQKANLTLRGVDAITDQYKINMTWNNINLQLLLGDMYDKYDNFNLKLDNIASDDDRTYEDAQLVDTSGQIIFIPEHYINYAGEDDSERIVTLNLSGLNFLNATYDASTNCNSSSTVIGTYKFYESFSKDFNNSIVTFTKGSDTANITIGYKNIITNTTPVTLSSYPNMTFLFSIYGIPKVVKLISSI